MKASEMRAITQAALDWKRQTEAEAGEQQVEAVFASASAVAAKGETSFKYKAVLNTHALARLRDNGYKVTDEGENITTQWDVSWKDEATQTESKTSPALKLFVWHNALADWTAGVMFALAHDADEARELISPGYRERRTFSDPARVVTPLEDAELKQEPKVYTSPAGFKVSGGS